MYYRFLRKCSVGIDIIEICQPFSPRNLDKEYLATVIRVFHIVYEDFLSDNQFSGIDGVLQGGDIGSCILYCNWHRARDIRGKSIAFHLSFSPGISDSLTFSVHIQASHKSSPIILAGQFKRLWPVDCLLCSVFHNRALQSDIDIFRPEHIPPGIFPFLCYGNAILDRRVRKDRLGLRRADRSSVARLSCQLEAGCICFGDRVGNSGRQASCFRTLTALQHYGGCNTINKRHVAVRAIDRRVAQRHRECELDIRIRSYVT